MQRRRFLSGMLLVAGCVTGLRSAVLLAQADPFVGSFSGEIDGVPHRLLIYSDSPGYYDGELLGQSARLPFIGQRFGENLMATIGFPGTSYRVRGRAVGGILVFELERGGRLVFHRQSGD